MRFGGVQYFANCERVQHFYESSHMILMGMRGYDYIEVFDSHGMERRYQLPSGRLGSAVNQHVASIVCGYKDRVALADVDEGHGYCTIGCGRQRSSADRSD